MGGRRTLALVCALGAIGAAALPSRASDPHAQAPVPAAWDAVTDGPTGRLLLEAGWERRLDPEDEGLAAGWGAGGPAEGWSAVSVPDAWNAEDHSEGSMLGGVAWYRTRFTLPGSRGALAWLVRFESVNYGAQVWLNGRRLGGHEGAHMPFEMWLDGAVSNAPNTLVVRVDSRRPPDGIPSPISLGGGRTTAGWWNDGGILREVTIRPAGLVDVASVQAIADLPCTGCDGRLTISAQLRGSSADAASVPVRARVDGREVTLGWVALRRGEARTLRRTVKVVRPAPWEPGAPRLHELTVTVGEERRAAWRQHVGFRRIEVRRGLLRINGRRLWLPGVGLHEWAPGRGHAIRNEDRRRLVDQARQVGAVLLRSHYPLHPQIHELADRLGLLIWSEVPAYRLSEGQLAQPRLRRTALAAIGRAIRAGASHPSVLAWSVGNELPPKAGPGQRRYLRDAAALVRRLDRSRPAALALAASPAARCRRDLRGFGLLGINEYFGWYGSPGSRLSDPAELGPFLDRFRRCHRRSAVIVSEFGAEASRHGPAEEKGTYEFQREFVRSHLGEFSRRAWLGGAAYWALNEFRVRPGWSGGNPQPSPPFHQKGLFDRSGRAKPAAEEFRVTASAAGRAR